MQRSYKIKKSEKGSGAPSRSNINYADELNPQQLAAVTSAPGPALVIAGAGSGKTRTLTYRVAYLLDQGIEARNILLLTFTNKAAREMLERVKSLVSVDCSDLWGGTFHSVGARILRSHADELGYTRSFSIMDTDDQKSLMRSILNEVDIQVEGIKQFPRAEVLLGIFSMAANTMEDLAELVALDYPYFEEFVVDIERVHQIYQERKLQSNSMDFDDLLVKTVELLKNSDELRARYEHRFQFVLVDEYQDTNKVQSEFIDLLVAKHKSLMVVGDDAQSIYSWRGADMEHILNFEDRYAGTQIYKIETNYRSVNRILALSNASIGHNRRQFHKTLRAAREEGEMAPAVVSVNDPSLQASFVAQRVGELIEEGMDPESIAVLYRAHFQSMEVQLELTNRGIPFKITSGLRFFEQAHIKDIAAFMRLATNRKDEVSFKRIVLNFPGVGVKSAEKLFAAWSRCKFCQHDEVPAVFSEEMLQISVPAKAGQFWEQFAHILDEFVEGGEYARPNDMIFSVMEGLYEEQLKANYENYDQRKQDIEQLMLFSEGFPDPVEFLGQLSLLSNTDGKRGGKRDSKDDPGVTLSSIHQAKGLEWKAVFVIWLTEGMFPNRKIIESGDADALEEERRLFYVAITRAEDQLYLTYPQINPKTYSGEFVQRPSRFLGELPSVLVEEWEIE